MSYKNVHHWLGWPAPEEAFGPSGAGAKIFVDFAKKKIQSALDVYHPGITIEAGVIAPDPYSATSEVPLALVCEFPRAASDEALDLVHKLAWNLSRTALLITLEPHRLIAWSCFQDPTQGTERRVCELATPDGFKASGTPEQQKVRDLLHWVNLITHRAQGEQPKKFPSDGRADALLLKNLRYVRGELLRRGLSQDHCHDLLARVIFTQFLFHRRDSDGNAFFSAAKMRRLQEDGVLARTHNDLASLLSHKTDTYSLFRWMDERFNGDLFPGKDGDEDARNAAWKTEKDAVSADNHLKLLAELIRGDLDVTDKQQTLWPHYSFDTIPLEFISSVYEEFLTAEERGNDKAYYTPSHLVDYILDAVLPWSSNDWNIRILDPCCGSGIFLVKAFQRLIHRWRRSHPGQEPLVRDLRPILENNLVGVDKNPEAVRVACFSLYLAMADAIEPKHYVTRDNYKVFPHLRGTRLLHRDFFDEETAEIRTLGDKQSFDLLLGNAPWGDGSILPDQLRGESTIDYRSRIKTLPPTSGQKWAAVNNWPVANNDIGPLFLAKSASLVKSTGLVAMLNTASLLYWRDGQAADLRKRLFQSFTFEEITNLSALRRVLFTQAIGPACIVVFRTEQPDDSKKLHYYAPKPSRSLAPKRGVPQTAQRINIEPNDVSVLTHGEAANEPFVWPLLAFGRARDLALIRKLMRLPTLAKLEQANKVTTRLGVIPGDRKKTLSDFYKRRRYFDSIQFPPDVFLEMDASTVPKWSKPEIDGKGSTDFEAFKSPQMLIKQSFSSDALRFRAALIKSDDPEWGVVCKKTYLSVRDFDSNATNIQGACVVYNSRFATYFLALTSSRIGHYITETLSKELVTVPLPAQAPKISSLNSFEAIDDAARKMFGFTAADWTLIEDFLEYTLPDVLRKTPGPARFPTQRLDKNGTTEPELTYYAKIFSRVVKGTFGNAKTVAATIFTDPDGRKLPVRMLTIHLAGPERTGISYEAMEADGLLDKLAEFHAGQLKQRSRNATGNGLGFQRVAYLFHPSREGGKSTMNLTIVKPDERRYWTRSTAMHDADQLASAISKAAVR